MRLRDCWCLPLLASCSSAAAPAVSRPEATPESADASYSVTRRSSSQPDRGQTATDVAPALVVDQSCNAESCEGDLSPAAIGELKKTLALAQDCYERELKENEELEGRLTLMLRLLEGTNDGAATCRVQIEGSTLKLSAGFESCLRETLSKTAARARAGCVDVAVPLVFVRQQVEAPAAGGGAGR